MSRYICIFFAVLLLSGCAHFTEDFEVNSNFRDAGNFFFKGSYQVSLKEYEQILAKYPARGDEALFEMGLIYSYPKNEQRDLKKSLDCFEKVVKNYPESSFRQSSEMMTVYLKDLIANDARMMSQPRGEDLMRQEIGAKENEILSLQRQLKSLDRKLVSLAVRNKLVDKVVVEKKQRRLTLLSKGEALKTYKIALGRSPVGAKEREGDNRTPEGTYQIDSRNYNSYYHLSLHISYPNEVDRKAARRMGVNPGGGISIHGLHGGWLQGGDNHSVVDWTDGCIAVTNEEIEELDQLVPNGMVVEIKP